MVISDSTTHSAALNAFYCEGNSAAPAPFLSRSFPLLKCSYTLNEISLPTLAKPPLSVGPILICILHLYSTQKAIKVRKLLYRPHTLKVDPLDSADGKEGARPCTLQPLFVVKR